MRRLCTGLICLLMVVCGAATAAAQVTQITGTERLGWDQGCPASQPACTTTAQTAQDIGYEMQIDGGAPIQLTGVVCTGTVKPFSCSANPPAAGQAPGQHTETMRAFIMVGTTKLTSAFSNVITVNVNTAPAAPSSFRRIPNP